MKFALYAAATATMFVTAGAATAADTQIFVDNFSQAAGSPDTSKWLTENQIQGRGKFEGYGWVNGSGQLYVSVNGYNPNLKDYFSQQLLKTKNYYAPGKNETLRIRARIKINHNQPGIVHGFFGYVQYKDAAGGNRSNELDFEWLTNVTSNKNPDDILVSVWNYWNRDNPKYEVLNDPVHGTHTSPSVPSKVDTNSWYVYEIQWSQTSVKYYVNGSLVKEFKTAGTIPTGAMQFFLNSWVADSSWTQAYNSGLKTSTSRTSDYSMLVDWFEIRRVTP